MRAIQISLQELIPTALHHILGFIPRQQGEKRKLEENAGELPVVERGDLFFRGNGKQCCRTTRLGVNTCLRDSHCKLGKYLLVTSIWLKHPICIWLSRCLNNKNWFPRGFTTTWYYKGESAGGLPVEERSVLC